LPASSDGGNEEVFTSEVKQTIRFMSFVDRIQTMEIITRQGGAYVDPMSDCKAGELSASADPIVDNDRQRGSDTRNLCVVITLRADIALGVRAITSGDWQKEGNEGQSAARWFAMLPCKVSGQFSCRTLLRPLSGRD
jgi:hypothetical protein